MYGKLAKYYDHIYSWKDYEKESEEIMKIIGKHTKGKDLLDVACGTGKHIEQFRKAYECTGVDASKEMIAVAKKRNPDVQFHVQRMQDMELGKKFDAITCLFSAIGSVSSKQGLRRTFASFGRHMNDDAVLIIEPWIEPEAFTPGIPFMTVYDGDDLKICRMNVSERKGDMTPLKFHFLIADREGVTYVKETVNNRLSSHEELLSYAERAGLKAKMMQHPLFERGLLIGVKA